MNRRPLKPKFNANEIVSLKGRVPLGVLIGEAVALERHGAEYLGLCPFHNEDTPSFRIYADGHYHCFGCGVHGDHFDWLVDRERMSFAGALRFLRQWAGDAEPENIKLDRHAVSRACDWKPVAPIPESAPRLVHDNGWTARIFNPKREGEPKEWTSWRPQLVHPYRDREGALLGYVLRCQFPGGKKFTPTVTFCENSTGEQRWCIVPLPRPRALYRLDQIAARLNAPILLVEGEKTADAAARLLPGMVATTWPGGAKAYAHADWSPLAGRRVLCVPDADAEGRAAFHGRVDDRGRSFPGIINVLAGAGSVATYVEPPASLPEGWDLADAEAERWASDRVIAWLKSNLGGARNAA